MQKITSEPTFQTKSASLKKGFFKAFQIHKKRTERRKTLMGFSSMVFICTLTLLLWILAEAPLSPSVTVIHTALSDHSYLVHNIWMKEILNWFAGLTPMNLVQGFLMISGVSILALALFNDHANASVFPTRIAAGLTNMFFSVAVGVLPNMLGATPQTECNSSHNVFCSITSPMGHTSTVHTHEYVTYTPQLLWANHVALRSHGHMDAAQEQQFYTDIHWLEHNSSQWFGQQRHAEPNIPSKDMYLARMELTAGVPYTSSTRAYIRNLKTQHNTYEFFKNSILFVLLVLVCLISFINVDYYYRMLRIKGIEMLTSNDPVFADSAFDD